MRKTRQTGIKSMIGRIMLLPFRKTIRPVGVYCRPVGLEVEPIGVGAGPSALLP
jgi:hypothetical protein